LARCLSRGSDAPLSEVDVALLANEMRERRFAGGTPIFKHGDVAETVFLLRSGTVELSRVVKGRRVILQILRQGDVFGDVPVLLGMSEHLDARAIEDSIVFELNRGALVQLLQTRPLVARRWFLSMADRMAGLQYRLLDVLATGIDVQLASLILREADESGRVQITQSNLAALLGVRRSSIHRVLKELEASGLIALRYRSVTVTDRSGLEAVLHA